MGSADDELRPPPADSSALDHPSKSERRHRYLHQRALEKLRAHPELRERCLALVDDWLGNPAHAHARPWLEEWRRMLALQQLVSRLAPS